MVKPSKDRCGRAASYSKGPFRAPWVLPYASGVASSSFGVKRAVAASIASGVRVQDVFLASAGRANSEERSQPRRRLGSMPRVAASALGVIVVGVSDMMNPFRLGAPHGRAACDSSVLIISPWLSAARKGLVWGL
jgi:hypothetical protein